MGWIALALLAAAAFGALVWLRLPRLLWSLAGAALCLGAAGYAWQGYPSLSSSPAQSALTMAPIDPEAIALRDSLFGRYSADTAYLVAADAMTRSGDDGAAARVILGGVSKYPQSFTLWTWLGTTLAADAAGQVSPPALLAFRRAAQLAPEHPAPPFYLGMAYIRASQFREARPYWARALALSPDGTTYRKEIAVRLQLLDRLLASGAIP